jgi:hypothetical protein
MDVNWQFPTLERPSNGLKRRATFEEDEIEEPMEWPPQDVKKHRQRSAIDNISLVSVLDAWDVDLGAILPHGRPTAPAIYVLCVVGSLTTHHDLLW